MIKDVTSNAMASMVSGFPKTGTYPNKPTLRDKIYHQLEQWGRRKQPQASQKALKNFQDALRYTVATDQLVVVRKGGSVKGLAFVSSFRQRIEGIAIKPHKHGWKTLNNTQVVLRILELCKENRTYLHVQSVPKDYVALFEGAGFKLDPYPLPLCFGCMLTWSKFEDGDDTKAEPWTSEASEKKEESRVLEETEENLGLGTSVFGNECAYSNVENGLESTQSSEDLLERIERHLSQAEEPLPSPDVSQSGK